MWSLIYGLPVGCAFHRSLQREGLPAKKKRKATASEIREMFGGHLRVVK